MTAQFCTHLGYAALRFLSGWTLYLELSINPLTNHSLTTEHSSTVTGIDCPLDYTLNPENIRPTIDYPISSRVQLYTHAYRHRPLYMCLYFSLYINTNILHLCIFFSIVFISFPCLPMYASFLVSLTQRFMASIHTHTLTHTHTHTRAHARAHYVICTCMLHVDRYIMIINSIMRF